MFKKIRLAIKKQLFDFLFFLKKNFQTRDNKIVIYSILVLLLSLLMLFLAFSVLRSVNSEKFSPVEIQAQQKEHFKNKKDEDQQEMTPKEMFYTKPEGELSELIQKANILYNDGRVEDALEIFEKISLYSQSLANYNLGVIRTNEKNYKGALRAFDRAIDGGDDISLSAINAAFCAFRIGDLLGFDRYLKLADSSLVDTNSTPFYSYLYGVIAYYKKQYFESLSPLLHPNSQDYIKQSSPLIAKMLLALGDDYQALEFLKKNTQKEDLLALGMLYARNGDYANAQLKIKEYLQDYPNDLEALSALELVEIKRRNYADAAEVLSSFDFEKKQKPSFRIKVGLKDELFDVNLAQQSFWNRKFEHRQSLQYKILFYYAPYRVFDSEKVFQILAEGEFEWGSGSIDEATDSYVRSKTISKINKDIAEGLKKIYSGDLYSALEIFLKNEKSYSQHAVLYYDIGLVYAQLGDFEKAYYYFGKAYNLNNKDILSGIFTMMTGQLVYQKIGRIEQSISADFLSIDFDDAFERDFLNALFEYVKNERMTPIENHQDKKPFYYAFQAVGAMTLGDGQKITEAFLKIKSMYANDLTTNILCEVAKNFGSNLKEMSLKFSDFFRRGSFSNMSSLYHGGSLTRELYIYLAFVTGNLSYVISNLQNELTVEDGSPIGTMQALGLAYIYNQEFEKAFVIYNNLIDNLKKDDVRTKFLGAVAAIGAGHHNNAVALLQISKLDSPASLESRYALALLYQQVGNYSSTINLLQSIANRNFRSEFFDFIIDTSEILQKAQE